MSRCRIHEQKCLGETWLAAKDGGVVFINADAFIQPLRVSLGGRDSREHLALLFSIDEPADAELLLHDTTMIGLAVWIVYRGSAYTTILPSCMNSSPSTVAWPPWRRSQIMSQWMALSLVLPLSG